MASELDHLQNGPTAQFSDWPDVSIPKVATGVYTVWEGATLIYVGMARTDLRKRLGAHSKGKRSGDQFSVYVADRFVLSKLTNDQVHAISAGTLSFDSVIREYISQHFSYRWIETSDGQKAGELEVTVRAGGLPAGQPLLNPLGTAI